MDVQNYITLKADSVISLSKTNNVVTLTSKQYDPQTGVQLADLHEEVDINFLKNRLNEAKATVSNIQAILNDIALL